MWCGVCLGELQADFENKEVLGIPANTEFSERTPKDFAKAMEAVLVPLGKQKSEIGAKTRVAHENQPVNARFMPSCLVELAGKAVVELAAEPDSAVAPRGAVRDNLDGYRNQVLELVLHTQLVEALVGGTTEGLDSADRCVCCNVGGVHWDGVHWDGVHAAACYCVGDLVDDCSDRVGENAWADGGPLCV
jgi:hypothetical protein